LVKEFIKALENAEGSFDDVMLQFEKFHPKVVSEHEDVTVWSIALNDETRDVRFVTADGGSGYIGEVVPVRKVSVDYAVA
jgi:hypothetical protein